MYSSKFQWSSRICTSTGHLIWPPALQTRIQGNELGNGLPINDQQIWGESTDLVIVKVAVFFLFFRDQGDESIDKQVEEHQDNINKHDNRDKHKTEKKENKKEKKNNNDNR